MYDADDFESVFSKEKLESLLKKEKYDNKLESLLDKCIEKCKVERRDVSSIVIAGGICRIPFIQNVLQVYLSEKMEKSCGLNKSINMDEHIAYGCSYYGLILDEVWKYEIIDNCDEELLSNYNENTKKAIIEIDNHLSHVLSVFTDSKVDNKDRLFLFDYFNSEFNTIKSSISIDSIEQNIEGIDYDTHLQEADKARNDMERDIYELQHDLQLINDKKFVEIENKYLSGIVEILHNDRNLRILHKVSEFEKDFYKIWEDKKTSKLPLAIVLCQLSVVAYPKQRLDYENQLKELNNLDKKKDPMSKYINMCNVYYYYMI